MPVEAFLERKRLSTAGEVLERPSATLQTSYRHKCNGHTEQECRNQPTRLLAAERVFLGQVIVKLLKIHMLF